MQDSFCYLGAFTTKDEAQAYYYAIKGKIEGLESLVAKTFPDANPQKEFVSQRTSQDVSSLYAPVKLYYDDINYTLGYNLKNYAPTGCVTQEDVFWDKYYKWLFSTYSETRIKEEVSAQEAKAEESSRKHQEYLNVIADAEEVYDLYQAVPQKGGITKGSFQSHLEEMIRRLQALSKYPELDLSGMTIYDKPIEINNLAFSKIIEFINNNRLQPVNFDPTPEGMKIAARKGKAKLGKFDKNGVQQTFLIANFNGQVEHMPLMRNEEGAETLNEIAPGVFIFGTYEQAIDTQPASTDF